MTAAVANPSGRPPRNRWARSAERRGYLRGLARQDAEWMCAGQRGPYWRGYERAVWHRRILGDAWADARLAALEAEA